MHRLNVGLLWVHVSMGTQSTHCGWVDLLILKELADTAKLIPWNITANNVPSVACMLVLPYKTEVAFSSSHLSPFNDGAAQIEPKNTVN